MVVLWWVCEVDESPPYDYTLKPRVDDSGHIPDALGELGRGDLDKAAVAGHERERQVASGKSGCGEVDEHVRVRLRRGVVRNLDDSGDVHPNKSLSSSSFAKTLTKVYLTLKKCCNGIDLSECTHKKSAKDTKQTHYIEFLNCIKKLPTKSS